MAADAWASPSRAVPSSRRAGSASGFRRSWPSSANVRVPVDVAQHVVVAHDPQHPMIVRQRQFPLYRQPRWPGPLPDRARVHRSRGGQSAPAPPQARVARLPFDAIMAELVFPARVFRPGRETLAEREERQPPPMPLSDAQLRQYHDDGFVIVRDFFRREELRAVMDKCHRCGAGPFGRRQRPLPQKSDASRAREGSYGSFLPSGLSSPQFSSTWPRAQRKYMGQSPLASCALARASRICGRAGRAFSPKAARVMAA